jgi:aryl-phospho-beta-D-glucosidase BglC (GH1 family)
MSEFQWLKASGGHLVHEDGTPYRLKSVAWYGFENVLMGLGLESRPYRTVTVDGVVYEGLLDQVASLGFNCMRITLCEDVTWPGRKMADSYTMSGIYNPDFLLPGVTPSANNTSADVITTIEVLDKVVAYCKKLGLRIFFDMHCSSPNSDNERGFIGKWYTTMDPGDLGDTAGLAAEPRSEAQLIAAWEFLAQHYLNEPTVCGFDLVNEPYACTWDDDPLTGWPAAAERIATDIQAINPNVLIIVEGIKSKGDVPFAGKAYTSWSVYAQDLAGVATRPVKIPIQEKLVYSPHEYTQAGQDWLSDADFPANMPIVWDAFWGFIPKQGIAPILIGEWGGNFETAGSTDVLWVGALQAYCDTNDISTSLWAMNASDTTGTVEGVLSSANQFNTNPGIVVQAQAFNALGPASDPAPDLGATSTLSVYELAFGTGLVGNTLPTQAFRLTNNGSDVLQISKVTVDGDFSLVGSTPATVAAGGGTAQLEVQFTPTALGARTGTLTIESNSLSSPDVVTLSGSGAVQTLGLNLGLSIAGVAGMANWSKTYEDNLEAMDTLAHLSVASMTVTAPPASPSIGDRYIVPTGATGEWAGEDGNVALVTHSGDWKFFTPKQGWQAFVEDKGAFYFYFRSVWVPQLEGTIWGDALFKGDHKFQGLVICDNTWTHNGEAVFNNLTTFDNLTVFDALSTFNNTVVSNASFTSHNKTYIDGLIFKATAPTELDGDVTVNGELILNGLVQFNNEVAFDNETVFGMPATFNNAVKLALSTELDGTITVNGELTANTAIALNAGGTVSTPEAFAGANAIPSAEAIPAQLQKVAAWADSGALNVQWLPNGPMQWPSLSVYAATPLGLKQNVIGNLALVIPQGATLGVVGNVPFSLALLAAWNNGVPVLCVVNLASGMQLDESNFISPTTISAASNSAGVIYSAAAVAANSSYRVIGYLNSQEPAAGTWTGIHSVQGTGGANAIDAGAGGLINNTAATSDTVLAVGQGAVIDVNNAGYIPLHIATADNQLYEVVLMFAPVNVAFSTSEVLLPNNTAYAGQFWSNGNFLNGFGLPSQFSAFSRLLVSTKTACKSVIGHALASATLVQEETSASVWCAAANTQLPADTTTLWNSLGSLQLSTPRTGRIVVRRIA